MSDHGGLPDFVADHFAYLVRSSPPARIARAAFFGLSVLLPPVLAIGVPFFIGGRSLAVKVLLIAVASGFLVTFLWYLQWITGRMERFRTERPASYARWFGGERGARLGLLSPRQQLRLAKLQFRYLYFSREPSPSETLALTMEFARRR